MTITEDERKFIMAVLNEQPLETVGQIALLKIAELAINCNSDETTLSAEATFNGKRYKCTMLVTWKKIKTKP